MDDEEVAARAAVACWHGREGQTAAAIRTANALDDGTLKPFLNVWILARSNPLAMREELLRFLNTHAMPAIRSFSQPSDEAYRVIETLGHSAVAEKATRGRPTSTLSKVGHAVSPLVFIPYDRRVRLALGKLGKGVRAHSYCDYMQAVLSEKAGFVRKLEERGLSAESLNASGMSQALFEVRALDKWLMLRGGFSKDLMMKDVRKHFKMVSQ
ncbi:hypothetical protein [Bradyrhizobium sp. AZCC 1699]|uniref:hypothetical protein n=1 Tax=Bradyrhizobium sp. AZCC 1699 TaxID=3117024 RepID=UPI002FF17DB3